MKIFLILFILTFLSLPAVVNAQNPTTVTALGLVPTYESIGVYANFSGDDNGNNQASLEYRVKGSSQWIPTTVMVVDRRAQINDPSGTVNNPYAYQWRASIVGLSSNTEYEVRVTYSDSDGVSGTNPVISSVKTRDDVIPLGTGTTYYVATSGSDTNAGTEASPWLTLQKAANTVSPGDTVLVKPGNYAGFTISRSGTSTNYVTFRSYDSNNKAIITSFPTLNGNYIRLRDFLFQDGISISNARFNILEGSELINRGIVLNNDVTGTLIQNNNIRNITANGPGGWERSGIFILPTATGGVVIRNNNFAGPCWDAIGGGSNFYIASGFQDTDIYNNYISGCSDDGIETEGGQINVRIWGNTLVNSGGNADFGLAVVAVGPTYVFRNLIIWKIPSSQNIIKLGGVESKGYIFFYHNTIYTNNSRQGFTDAGGRAANNIGNVISRNNILQIERRVIYNYNGVTQDISSFDDTVSFDYDNLYKTGGGGGNNYAVWDGGYYDFAAFRTGKPDQEINGMSAVSQFIDVPNNNFRLQSTSPEINKGVVIVGFNDANSPWPYRGSAPDIGAFEYDSGAPPVDTTPPSASISINSGASTTSSTSVTLTLSCSDASGVKDVRYSNDGVFDTEVFEAFASSKPWTLTSGDGTKTVWYQCRDNSANQNTETVSDTIVLDTVAPVTSIVSVEGDTTTPYTDTINDGNTDIIVGGESGMVCRWYDSDVSYTDSSGTVCSTSGTQTTCTVTTTSGSYTKFVACKDAAGNGQSSANNLDVSWTVSISDTTPPVISSVSASTTVSSATITWLTDDASNSTVNYGLTASLGSSQANTTLVTSHLINLTGLTDNTTYYYQVRSCNSNNLCSSSAIDSFTTQAASGVRIISGPYQSGGGGGGGCTAPINGSVFCFTSSSFIFQLDLGYSGSGLKNVTIARPPNSLNATNWRVVESGIQKSVNITGTSISWTANLSASSAYLTYQVAGPVIKYSIKVETETNYQHNFTISSDNSLYNLDMSVSVNSSYRNWRLYWYNSSWIDATTLFRLNISNSTAAFYGFNMSDQQFRIEGSTEACVDADMDNYYKVDAACSLGNDCNDNNVAVNPSATEVCGNGIDENCDGIDDTCPTQPPTPPPSGGGVVTIGNPVETPITKEPTTVTTENVTATAGTVSLELITPVTVESGEMFNVTVWVLSPVKATYTLTVGDAQQEISLDANKEEMVTIPVRSPEAKGSYTLTASIDGTTRANDIDLDYLPLFLYVSESRVGNETFVNVTVKNYESMSTELRIIKDGRSDAFFELIEGKKEYNRQLKLTQAGEYKIVASASSQGKIIDTDEYLLTVGGEKGSDYRLLMIIVFAFVVMVITLVVMIR